jgi:RNA polymerase sigma-70 factor (ECF subfamily)
MHEIEPSTESLLQQARMGDAQSLNRLLDVYRNYLCLLARMQTTGQLRGRIDSSDLVQETLLRAYQAFPGFRGNSEIEVLGWLRKILASSLTDQLKLHQSGKRDVRREQSLESVLNESSRHLSQSLAAANSSPSAAAQRREQSVILADALSRLPMDYQEVIIQRQLKRKPFAQIAQEMGRSSGAVRMLWTRALERLRDELEQPR